MVCEHLQPLYQLCVTQQIRLSSSDLVHFVCKQCDSQDTCPSGLMEHYDEEDSADQNGSDSTTEPPNDTSGSSPS